jgi:hypothetical protein
MARDATGDGAVLITGASAGIGRELARVFAELGHDLVLVARSADKLSDLSHELEAAFGIECHVIVADLTRPGATEAVHRETCEAGIEVEILVNNAGVGNYGPFAETGHDKLMEIVALNVATLTSMTGLFLPAMVERGHGRILNVGSVAGFQPTPLVALYGATKAFILSLTEALSVELEDTGVTATVLCPGFTGTELIDNLAEAAGSPGMVPDFVLQDPRTVAREGVVACLEGRPVHVNGTGYQLGVMWESWQPRWLMRSMSSMITRMMPVRRGPA